MVPRGGMRYSVTDIIMHKDYKHETYFHDIAIIFVTPSFDFSDPKTGITEIEVDLSSHEGTIVSRYLFNCFVSLMPP